MGKNKRTIAIDFDGVLHRYSDGWRGGEIYDEPVEGAVEACWRLRGAGYELVVNSTRNADPALAAAMGEWLVEVGFPTMGIPVSKVPAIAYIDDRGIRFTNWRDMEKYFK